MRSLYHISQEMAEIKEILIQNDGELTDDLEHKLVITEKELEEKSANYGIVIKDYSLEIEALDNAIQDLQQRKQKRLKAQQALKDKIANAMQEFGLKKVETPIVTLSFRKSTSVQIDDEDAISSEFVKTKITSSISKTEIKKALEAGKAVTGARIIEKQNLIIK